MIPKIVVQSEVVYLPYSRYTVKVRPFNVGTEKSMLLAREAGKRKLAEFIGELIAQHVDGLQGPVDQLPAYEVDLLFAHIRMLSVSDTVDLVATCNSCGHKTDISVRIEPEVDVEPPREEVIAVEVESGEATVALKPVSYGDIVALEGEEGDVTVPEVLWHMLVSIKTPDEMMPKESINREEFIEWAGDIPAATISELIERSKWRVNYKDVEFSCPECGSKQLVRFDGILDFFI